MRPGTARGRTGRSQGSLANEDGALVDARRNVAFENHIIRSRTKSPPRRTPPGLVAPIAEGPMHSRGLGEGGSSQEHDEGLVVPWVGARSPPASPAARSRVLSWDSWATLQSTPSSQTHDSVCSSSVRLTFGQATPMKDRRKQKEARETLARLRVRYTTMSPATRKFMARSLQRVERILELILARKKSRYFTLWRCKTLYERAVVAKRVELVCDMVGTPDHRSSQTARRAESTNPAQHSHLPIPRVGHNRRQSRTEEYPTKVFATGHGKYEPSAPYYSDDLTLYPSEYGENDDSHDTAYNDAHDEQHNAQKQVQMRHQEQAHQRRYEHKQDQQRLDHDEYQEQHYAQKQVQMCHREQAHQQRLDHDEHQGQHQKHQNQQLLLGQKDHRERKRGKDFVGHSNESARKQKNAPKPPKPPHVEETFALSREIDATSCKDGENPESTQAARRLRHQKAAARLKAMREEQKSMENEEEEEEEEEESHNQNADTNRNLEMLASKRGSRRSVESLFSPRTQGKRVGARVLLKSVSRLVFGVVSRAFASWKANALDAAREGRRLRRIVRRWRHGSLGAAFAQWKRVTRRPPACVAVAPFLEQQITSPSAVRRKEQLYKRIILRALNRKLYIAFSHWSRFSSRAKLLAQADSFRHQQRELFLRQAVLRLRHNCIAHAFARWQHGVQDSQRKRWEEASLEKQRIAARRCCLRMLRRQQTAAFNTWKISTRIAKRKLLTARRVILRLVHHREHAAFRRWVEMVRSIRVNASKMSFLRALMRAKNQLKQQKTLHTWRMVTARDSQDVRRKQHLLKMAMRKLSLSAVNRAFQTWKHHCHHDGMMGMKRLCMSFLSWKMAARNARGARELDSVRHVATFATMRRLLRGLANRKLRSALQKWKGLTSTTTRVRTVLLKMTKYRVRASFAHWRAMSNYKGRAVNVLVQWCTRWTTTVMRQSLRTWQAVSQKAREAERQERLLLLPMLRLSRSAQSKVFFAWREFARVQKRESAHNRMLETMCREVKMQHSRKIMRAHLQAWNMSLRRNKRRYRVLREWMRRTVLESLSWAWRRWTLTVRVLEEVAILTTAHKSVVFDKDTSLETTQIRVAQRMAQRKQLQLAIRVFSAWAHATRARRAAKQAIKRLRRTTLRSRFDRWTVFANARKAGRRRKAFFAWVQHTYSLRALGNLQSRSRATRRKMRAFTRWRMALREERRVCRRLVASLKRLRLQEGFGALRAAASMRHARALEQENTSLSVAHALWSNNQKRRIIFVEWARVTGVARRAAEMQRWRQQRAVGRLRDLSLRARARREAEAFSRVRLLRGMLRRWRRYTYLRMAADNMLFAKEQRMMAERLALWRRHAALQRERRNSQHAGLVCLGAAVSKWQRNMTRRAFSALARWSVLVRSVKRALTIRARVLLQYQQRAFLVWHTRALCVDLAALRRHNRKLRQANLRSKHAARVAEEETARTQAKAQALQVKIDRLMCRNHPRTEREQDAEERYYKRRGPDAGRPSPLPAQSPSKKSATKKTKLKRKKKLQVEIGAVERAALHGSLSWVPRSPPAAQRSLQLDDIREPAARNKNDSRGSDVLVVSDLPLSPLMRSERDLDALEDSIMTEVRDLSNSYGAISLAASSARASGYGGATFDPALEGLATKIIRKEGQLQMVGQTRKSIHESFDLSSDEDDGSGDYCGTNNEKRRGRRGTMLY